MSQLQPVPRSQSAPPFSRINPMPPLNQPVPNLNDLFYPPPMAAVPNPTPLLPSQPTAATSPSPFSPQPVAASSGKSEGKSSKMSKRKRVEFIPPVEYIDVSGVFIRFVQLLIMCELAFFLYVTASSLVQIHIYIDFLKALTPHIMYAVTVTPLSIVLAVVFSYRSIQGLFAVNFTTAAEPVRALYGLIALICSRLVYGGVIVAAGFVLNNEIASKATKDSLAKNVAHLIHYATKDPEYMEEINRIQQNFQCCGVSTNIDVGNATYTSSDHPWNMWFATYSLDETYPNTIRELYSLPWSCCNMTANVKCEHIGISRYLRTFETPTDFSDVEAALEVEELKWNPTNFDHYLSRNKIAEATLYSSDCSEKMFERLAEEADKSGSSFSPVNVGLLPNDFAGADSTPDSNYLLIYQYI
ncbi:unnamed protein product [Cylicocyclus nassatus]|uniref:Tetraspanin n=1 Tax=Cylicocyclus nassatus TaxID=53992 RepID=A0AA36MAA6_CYLNA|nr:unnamed protein product [Cylicocyclus nassatus]